MDKHDLLNSRRLLVCLLIILCAIVMLLIPKRAEASVADAEFKLVDFTCYIDKGTCYTGCQTRHGIAASSEALMNYTIIVYQVDDKGQPGEMIGIYEVLDKIGTEWGRSGTLEEPHVVDIWCETMSEAKELMKLTKGKVYIQIIWAEG